jgi:hypothetical protein
MARMMNSLAWRIDMSLAMPKMIRPCLRRNLRTGHASDAIWIGGHVENRTRQ